jgi:hypothetical protein
MVIGMAYRLLPMMLPAAMPPGRTLYASAIAIEAGLAILFAALLAGAAWLPLGALMIAGGIAIFLLNVRRILRARKPRPPALPRRDWSIWQTQAAMAWLLVAAACGLALSLTDDGTWRLQIAWLYGTSGLVGFLAQMVAGVQGRLVPWHVWYRDQARLAGATPLVAANALPSATHARTTFVAWAIGVPALAAGLATTDERFVRAGALALLAGVTTGAAHMRHMARRVRERARVT